MTLRAGLLKHRVLLAKNGTDRDKFGKIIDSGYEAVTTFYCSVKVVNSADTTNEEKTINIETLELRTRYNKTVDNYTPDMFILFKGKKYDITGIENYRYNNESLTITVKLRT